MWSFKVALSVPNIFERVQMVLIHTQNKLNDTISSLMISMFDKAMS